MRLAFRLGLHCFLGFPSPSICLRHFSTFDYCYFFFAVTDDSWHKGRGSHVLLSSDPSVLWKQEFRRSVIIIIIASAVVYCHLIKAAPSRSLWNFAYSGLALWSLKVIKRCLPIPTLFDHACEFQSTTYRNGDENLKLNICANTLYLDACDISSYII